MSGAELKGDGGELPVRDVTVNQLVGFNMKWFRRASGVTQEELGRRLGGWSKGIVSAAERSWDSHRVRQFDADELVRIAGVLGLPVVALLLPPPDAGTGTHYRFDPGAGAPLELADLLSRVVPGYAGDTPAMAAFRERVLALGASRYLNLPGYPEVEAIFGRARQEADSILTKSRLASERITSHARARAESLERDAQERHRQAMEELEQRVDDLREFEREYRIRLIRYHDEALRELLAGAADEVTGPAVSASPAEDGTAQDGNQ